MELKVGDYTVKGKHGDYTLYEKHVCKSGKTKGEEYDKPIAYHGTVYQALKRVLDCRIGEDNVKDVKTILDTIQSAKKDILKTLKSKK